MRVTDSIFALICGRMVGFLAEDFLKEWGIEVGFLYHVVLWVLLPFFSLLCLWIAYKLSQKILWLYQAAKHVLAGAFATVIDLKFFEFLLVVVFTNSLLVKGISFLFSTLIKYWGNKYWAFQKHEKENWRQELIQFFLITFVGLVIDVAFFFYVTHVLGPQFGFTIIVWTKLSVLFAAVVASVWNFLGYKFLVFKK